MLDKVGILAGSVFARAVGLGIALVFLSEFSALAADRADKTGTNPINFTYDARIFNEYQWLNTDGDSNQNITTLEFRAPFASGKWQFRTRARYVTQNQDLNDDGIDEIDRDGMGEVDFRFLTVPYLDMANRRAIAVGFEISLPTASQGLGSQRLSFGPQVFGVFFAPFGIKNSLVAPAYQHKFSVWEASGDRSTNLHQGLFDVFFLKTTADKQQWAMVNPQYILDYKNDTQFGLFEVEFGTMLTKIGLAGSSVFMRPSVQFGPGRAAEGSIEFGFKSVW